MLKVLRKKHNLKLKSLFNYMLLISASYHISFSLLFIFAAEEVVCFENIAYRRLAPGKKFRRHKQNGWAGRISKWFCENSRRK